MTQHNILIVEDDPVTAKIFFSCLQELYTPYIASNINDAKQLIHQHDISVLILDYILPDGTALDILDFLENNQIDKPSIVCTKFNETQNMIAAWKKGAFDFIQKPIDKTLLLEHIKMALNFTPPYALKKSNYMQTIKDIVLTPILDIEALLSSFENDQEAILSTLQKEMQEVHQHLSFLQNINLNQQNSISPEHSPIVFQLNAIKRSSKSIHAKLLESNSESILQAFHRGDAIQKSDINHLEKSIQKLQEHIVFVKDKLTNNAKSNTQHDQHNKAVS